VCQVARWPGARTSRVALWIALLAWVLAPPCAHAGLDHVVPLDQSGIWARSYQQGLEYGVIGLTVGGALWLGNDNELGHTFWQTLD